MPRAQDLGIALLTDGHLTSGSLQAFRVAAVSPTAGIVWRVVEWMQDLGEYRNDLPQSRDDVAEWEFERRIGAGDRA